MNFNEITHTHKHYSQPDCNGTSGLSAGARAPAPYLKLIRSHLLINIMINTQIAQQQRRSNKLYSNLARLQLIVPGWAVLISQQRVFANKKMYFIAPTK